MITFMDYIVRAFGTSTNWDHDNSYAALTATSDALLSFHTPSTLRLHVSSLSTANFASSYTLSTLGQIDGSISYLYSTVPLSHVASQSPSIPLRTLSRGYRDVTLPVAALERVSTDSDQVQERKPTLLHASLALPPPSTLNALYARRISPETLLSISLNSKSVSLPTTSGPPPAAVLAHVQHDTGRYSIEGLGSTDHALLGVRGLYNFGLSRPRDSEASSTAPRSALEFEDGLTHLPVPAAHSPSSVDILASHRANLAAKPSLLSMGGEFYYSPTSHVIGLSTGLRFTTLAPHIRPSAQPPHTPTPSKPLAGTSAALSSALLTPSSVTHSSFPYTMTLTLTPLTGSLASTYSVKPTPNLALSSRFDFNVYSWESQYVVGAEIWRRRRRRTPSAPNSSYPSNKSDEPDPLAWAQEKVSGWFTDAELQLKRDRAAREEENVLNLRVDDSWNIRALWTGRVKHLLVSAGVSVTPVRVLAPAGTGDEAKRKAWTGTVGVEVAYST